MPQQQDRRVAVVTGASRGLGKGIALALGEAGYTVYVTGRSVAPGSHDLGGTIGETAEQVTERGGTGVAVACDHRDDGAVAALVEQVRREQGHLDLLVNNAFAVPDEVTAGGGFWEKPLDAVMMFDVGLRSTYTTTWHATPLLLESAQRAPLVVNISGFGAVCYLHGPAYGAVKAGVDKMTHDMAVDLADTGVSVVALWPGLLRTERTMRVVDADPDLYAASLPIMEHPELTGRVIAALAGGPAGVKREKTGRALIGAELASELGVSDVDGRTPVSRRDLLGGPVGYSDVVVR
ncbi:MULTISPECIES: SDR family NAD(P)-dependent oxidoreductase [unclassified Nocardioides]|uniref:SDR family NAD(P)-dependent oxidoreductase n=1 Tax=unclassified Nocardioides TaxID=2615069 RepID=UPI001150BA07|nr:MULTISPECIES: SDR family NAD(P)-dependent oxidoreductase [unclassified Nocardioides]TQK72132.1 NAD(P)-dependent dehydrogenase (short-subunit alcohol dehydrogenase family) [Nocardioides sp. SLBN-35]WGY03650.1 SDR family NAD(P)-dependent oxidoreductase [Nocardioides sp. QY071]